MASIVIWLVAHVAVILTGVWLAIGFVIRRRTGILAHASGAAMCSSAALAGLYLLIGADVLSRSPLGLLGAEWALIGNAIIMVLTLGFVIGQVWIGQRLSGNAHRWKMAGLVGLLVWQVAMIGWSGWRYREEIVQVAGIPDGGLELDPVAGKAILTDKQRMVPLYRARLVGGTQTFLKESGYAFANAIKRTDSDLATNCHGWVFTGGKYLIDNKDVQMILDDNGYQRVDKPQVGDVIVYRDSADEVVHSGLVRLVFGDGQVLIESKWGVTGRFLHRAKEPTFSEYFAYYRTDRSPGRSPEETRHLAYTVEIAPGDQHLAGQTWEGRPPLQPSGRIADEHGNPWPHPDGAPIGAE